MIGYGVTAIFVHGHGQKLCGHDVIGKMDARACAVCYNGWAIHRVAARVISELPDYACT